MKVCKKENSVLYKNSNECHNMEYPLGDPDINVSVATVSIQKLDTVLTKELRNFCILWKERER